jgi:hypothetical protein
MPWTGPTSRRFCARTFKRFSQADPPPAHWCHEPGPSPRDRSGDCATVPAEIYSKASGVYAFVHDCAALYVGIAASGLAARFSAYTSPASKHRTAQRLHALLLLALGTVHYLDILTAAPPNSCWNGWPVNATAGLEVGLIGTFDLRWNFRGAGKRLSRRPQEDGHETARLMPMRTL